MKQPDKTPTPAATEPQTATEQAQQAAQAEVDKVREPGFRRRVIALAVILGIILLIFIARLVQYQLVDGRQYRQEAEGAVSVSQQMQ